MKIKLYNTNLEFVTKGTATVIYNESLSSVYTDANKLLLAINLTNIGVNSGDTISIQVTAPSEKQAIWSQFSIFQTYPVVDYGYLDSGEETYITIEDASRALYISSKNADSSAVDGDCQVAVKISLIS